MFQYIFCGFHENLWLMWEVLMVWSIDWLWFEFILGPIKCRTVSFFQILFFQATLPKNEKKESFRLLLAKPTTTLSHLVKNNTHSLSLCYFTILFWKHCCTLVREIRGGTFKLVKKCFGNKAVLQFFLLSFIKHDIDTKLMYFQGNVSIYPLFLQWTCRIAAILKVPPLSVCSWICQTVSFFGMGQCLVRWQLFVSTFNSL